jgi:hypothetical protein
MKISVGSAADDDVFGDDTAEVGTFNPDLLTIL